MNLDAQLLNRLYRYCLSLTRNDDTAYDLLHSGVERVLRAAPADLENPEAYLVRTLRNLFYDNERHHQRHKSHQDEMSVAALPSGEETRFDDLVLARDELEPLLARLRPEDRELLYLSAVEGRTAAELAELLSCPRGTVLARLHRLKGKLRQELTERGGASCPSTS